MELAGLSAAKPERLRRKFINGPAQNIMSTALLVIDVQNDYFAGGRMALPGSGAAARNVAKLIGAFRGRKQPVIHIRHVSTRDGAAFFIPGTTGTDIRAEAKPMPDETVIEKHFPNSFRDTSMLSHLNDRNITNLVICGMMSEMCVDATVRAAFDLGFKCTVAHDACAAADRVFGGDTIAAGHVHAAFMSALGAVYARLAGTDELIAETTQAGFMEQVKSE